MGRDMSLPLDKVTVELTYYETDGSVVSLSGDAQPLSVTDSRLKFTWLELLRSMPWEKDPEVAEQLSKITVHSADVLHLSISFNTGELS
jgi:hypothetical protein